MLSNELDDVEVLFKDIFKEDYIEHHLIDIDDDNETLNELGYYVFVHCYNYVDHINDMYTNRNIRNVLNGYSDIKVIPEEEVFATRKTPMKVIEKDEYKVNRSGFFMFGDIIKVLHGSKAKMQGIIISKTPDELNKYTVLFRLFVRTFTEKIHISQLEFITSLFNHIKIAVPRGKLHDSKKRTKLNINIYNTHVKRAYDDKLVKERKIRLRRIIKTLFIPDIHDLCLGRCSIVELTEKTN